MRLFLLAYVMLGCGDDGNMLMPDAPIDMPVVVDPPGVHHYVVDKMMVPSSNTEARTYAMDLNGDSLPDNQLGMVLSTLAGMGIESQAAMTKAIDTGAVILLGDLFAEDLNLAPTATFTIWQGTSPSPPACAGPQDTTCRKHLSGNAHFNIDTSVAGDPPLAGAMASTQFTGGPGHLTIPIVIFDPKPIRVTLIGARAKLANVSHTAVPSAVIAGAISATDVDTKVIPAMREGIMTTVSQDCTMLQNPPDCGCKPDSTGRQHILLFDVNDDCDISVTELRNNSLIQSLFAPDVMIEGQMALSVGVGATMVGAAYTTTP